MLGQRIKQLRQEHDITQKELADFLGVTPKAVSFYELGQRMPPNEMILKLAQKFCVSTDYLLGNKENITAVEREGYYTNPEAAKMAQEIYDNPDMKILFDAAKDVSPEDLKFVADMVSRMRKKERNEDD